MLFGITEILGEAFVEFGERVSPCFLAFFNLVELFFETRGVLDIENVAEVFHQQIGDDQTDFRGRKLPSYFLHVLALLDRAENRGIRGRTADAAFFELLYQRRFVVARRRLGEMLLGLQFSSA